MRTEGQICFEQGGFVSADGRSWRFDEAFGARLILRSGEEIPFTDAGSMEKTVAGTGLGECERVVYASFPGYPGLSFETNTLINRSTNAVDCSFVMRDAGGLDIKEAAYPPPLIADGEGAYAVLNTMQGQLLPSDWDKEIGAKMPFDGQMCSESAYMPWFGEITKTGGYLCHVRQSWDAAYTIRHPAGGPTRVFVRHLPSLGKFEGERTVSYHFVPAGSDYRTLCRLYRRIADAEGYPVTLREKILRNPGVQKLIGCAVLHVPCKTHVTKDSYYYDSEHPEKNDSLTPFSRWIARAEQLKSLGVQNLYVHLDGWGQPGYDNKHPDYPPACEEAGGWAGMRALSDTLRRLGYLFGIHDQYRDYYLDAPTYDRDNAAKSADGSVFEMSRWAGGKQNYLCAALAPDYVRRNFDTLEENGVRLDAAYLDVFTCNELDECTNPRHRMTRRECAEYRNRCFHFLTARGIAPSSEEVNDWAVGAQVFCHWAPYYGVTAIPVPLYNLVYHDCVMIPWKLEAGEWGIPEGTKGALHAMLNGGMGYMSEAYEGEELKENIRLTALLAELQQRVAHEKMTDHEFLTGDRASQRTTFGDGTRVTVNFAENTYRIDYPDGLCREGRV